VHWWGSFWPKHFSVKEPRATHATEAIAATMSIDPLTHCQRAPEPHTTARNTTLVAAEPQVPGAMGR